MIRQRGYVLWMSVAAMAALAVAGGGGFAGGKRYANSKLEARAERAERELADLKKLNADARADQAEKALAQSFAQQQRDVDSLKTAIENTKTNRTIIREIEHLPPSADCRRLPAEYGRLRNAALAPIIVIPAETPPSSSALPAAASSNPAPAPR